MNADEIRKLDNDQLKAEIAAARAKLYKLRTQAVTEKVENTGQFREMRRDLARMLTERTVRHAKATSAGAARGAKAGARA